MRTQAWLATSIEELLLTRLVDSLEVFSLSGWKQLHFLTDYSLTV